MGKAYLSESELKKTINEIYREEQIRVVTEKWNKLSENDKRFVLEFLKVIYPEKARIIRESKWYNTIGDIVGIFDPTGVVDLINGISYWRQGDKLYAILSWISVIPYIGDIIGKPVVGLFKMGRGGAKAFKAASAAGDYAKMAEIASKGGPLKGLLTKVSQWAPKILEPLKKLIGKVPFVGSGFIKAVEDFIKLFKDAGRSMDQGARLATFLTKKGTTKALTQVEKETLKKALGQATSFRGFRDFGGGKNWLQFMKSDASFMSKVSAGMPRLWGNPATRSLMRKTKWYLGFLDFLGLGNFVGPDELEQQVPDLESKMNEYSKTKEASDFAKEDFAGFEQSTTTAPPPPSSEPESTSGGQGGIDPISALASLFGAGSNKTSGLSI